MLLLAAYSFPFLIICGIMALMCVIVRDDFLLLMIASFENVCQNQQHMFSQKYTFYIRIHHGKRSSVFYSERKMQSISKSFIYLLEVYSEIITPPVQNFANIPIIEKQYYITIYLIFRLIKAN